MESNNDQPSLFSKEDEQINKNKPKSHSFEEVVEMIKDKVKIPDLIELDYQNAAVCPFQGNSPGNKSFKYYPETESWCCFHSDEHSDCTGGHVIHLYMKTHKISFGEAAFEMCKEFNIEVTITEKTKEEIKMQANVEKAWETLSLLCQRQLLNNKELYDAVKQKRGFTIETMQQLRIGLFDNDIKNSMEDLFSKEILFEAGFLGKGKQNWITGRRIVYTYFGMNKKPIYFIFRLIPEKPDYAPNRKYIKLSVNEVIKND